VAADPTWPVILTNNDWQKKKGNIAKIAGKSGVGEAMTAADKAFKKINWPEFDARNILPAQRDVDRLQAKKKALPGLHKTTVEPARVELKKLRDQAAKVAGEWKKNKLMPASSAKHAELVAKAADQLFITLAGNSAIFAERIKTYDDMIAVKQKMEQDELKKFDVIIANLEQALKEAAANPTKKTWSDGNTSAHQRCRSACNAIRNIPKLKAKYWGTWQKFGDNYERDCPDGERETAVMREKINTVKTELAKLKANYHGDLA
jgi:hypothetical protein